MENTHILIVDDEVGIRFFLEETLQKVGYEISMVSSGEEAMNFLKDTDVDLIFLDLNLGGRVHGHRVLEAVKWRSPETLVIILTAHASMDSALAAIREGVDGYLRKPVGPEEIRQVVSDVLNRRKSSTHQQNQEVFEYLDLLVDQDKNIAKLDGNLLALTSSEFKLLAYFLRNAEKVISPKELVKVVRNYECDDEIEAREIIKWYIFRLRKKIEKDPSNPKYIVNVRGVGYLLGE